VTGNRHDPGLVEVGFDLAAHETARLAVVVAALAEQPGWDPGQVLADEAAAGLPAAARRLTRAPHSR
jgi:hypothetical protein